MRAEVPPAEEARGVQGRVLGAPCGIRWCCGCCQCRPALGTLAIFKAIADRDARLVFCSSCRLCALYSYNGRSAIIMQRSKFSSFLLKTPNLVIAYSLIVVTGQSKLQFTYIEDIKFSECLVSWYLVLRSASFLWLINY